MIARKWSLGHMTDMLALRMRRAVLCGVLALCTGAGGALAQDSATGLTDPTLSFGLNGVSDYSSAMPFLDIARTMRPWIGHKGGKWGGMPHEDLQAGGYLDADGWVTQVPPGLDAVGTIWDWSNKSGAAAARRGVYVLTYAGEGTLEVKGAVEIRSARPGRIVFENMAGKKMFLNIIATDPERTGNYIRDISIVPQKYEALHAAGAVFNPDWLALVSEARQLRFMDWMQTNNSTQAGWDGRPQLSDATWMANGVPMEIMVQLANEAGVDPWFCMPHGADDGYIRAFASYVRDHLDPRLKAYVEYSNEAWNPAFQQYHWLIAQSKADWGKEGPISYYAKRATEAALIWEDVFGDQADARLVNVIGGQSNSPWLAGQVLDAPTLRKFEPDLDVDPGAVFEALAITNYFGGKSIRVEAMRDELLAEIARSDRGARVFLARRMLEPDYEGSIPFALAKWRENKAIAEKYGLRLIGYEGGQHVHHSFKVKGLNKDSIAVLTEFMTGFVRSPEMAELYRELWDAWASVGDGPFMQFGEAGEPSKYGSWGLLSDLADSNPRATWLLQQNRTTPSWWGEAGGAQYQQGVTLMAAATDGVMAGTREEDYLIGGAGDDTIIAGLGNDGINGQDGQDRLVLAGKPGDYTLKAEGAGYRLTGPDGSDFVINVESFGFDGGEVRTLADMPSG